MCTGHEGVDREAGFEQSLPKRVPGIDLLVGEHDEIITPSSLSTRHALLGTSG